MEDAVAALPPILPPILLQIHSRPGSVQSFSQRDIGRTTNQARRRSLFASFSRVSKCVCVGWLLLVTGPPPEGDGGREGGRALIGPAGFSPCMDTSTH